MNKIFVPVFCILLGAASVQHTVYGMISWANNAEITYVYSHGFGEPDGNCHGPTYPDAPGNLSRACFYTKPAVHTLANYLQAKVANGSRHIYLGARSCGAGTALTCLEKLVNYDADYFEGTKIQTKADADDIVTAINDGALELDVPLLSLKKAKAISLTSSCLGLMSSFAACVYAYRHGHVARAIEGVGYSPTKAKALLGVTAAGLVAHYLLGPFVKNVWATGIDGLIMPCITRFNYNPFHTKPIDAAKALRGKITCPILIHVCKKDGALDDPDETTVQLYAALCAGNGTKTHIVVTDDGGHNTVSSKHLDTRSAFMAHYGVGPSVMDSTEANTHMIATQPTVADLRRNIRQDRSWWWDYLTAG